METINFKLSSAIVFDKDGTPGQESFELILKAPSYNERKFARKLKQRLTEAMMYVTRQASAQAAQAAPTANEVEKEDDKMDGQSILFMLQSVPENILDWSEFAEWFVSNCSTVISVDEGVGLTTALVSQMSIDDADSMVGNYLANFTWPSLMKGTGSQ
tara:strand:- start:9652 stop:10125 length:474 start_codon:yes stop_codon:yes gene_type:complete